MVDEEGKGRGGKRVGGRTPISDEGYREGSGWSRWGILAWIVDWIVDIGRSAVDEEGEGRRGQTNK